MDGIQQIKIRSDNKRSKQPMAKYWVCLSEGPGCAWKSIVAYRYPNIFTIHLNMDSTKTGKGGEQIVESLATVQSAQSLPVVPCHCQWCRDMERAIGGAALSNYASMGKGQTWAPLPRQRLKCSGPGLHCFQRGSTTCSPGGILPGSPCFAFLWEPCSFKSYI